MSTEPKLPPMPNGYKMGEHYEQVFSESQIHAYSLQCFEAGRQQGMTQADALHRLAESSREIEAGPQWVSVEDRLPEIGTECLVYSRLPWEKAPSIKMDGWDEQHEAPVSFSSATVPIGPGWNCHDDFESVTHWMPLPEEPKG